MTDDELQAFMDANKGLFKSLSEGLMCPACHKVVKPPFFNLGAQYHQAEGCEACYKGLTDANKAE